MNGMMEEVTVTCDSQTVSTAGSDTTTLNNLLAELTSLKGQVEQLLEWKSSIDGGTKSMKEAFTVKEMQAKLPQVRKYGTVLCHLSICFVNILIMKDLPSNLISPLTGMLCSRTDWSICLLTSPRRMRVMRAQETSRCEGNCCQCFGAGAGTEAPQARCPGFIAD